MSLTLKELMRDLGCEKYPSRWETFFSEVIDKLDSDGNPLATPEYYTFLNREYRVLENHLDIYKKAAAQISKNRLLSIFLALLCRAMDDRGDIRRDLASLSFPKAKEGEDPLAYNMITGLALCKSIPSFYQYMKTKNLPEDVILASLRIPEDSVNTFMRKNNGIPGFASFEWYQLFYDRRLYRIGGLNMEFPAAFPSIAKVLQNQSGETVAIATNVLLHRDGFPLGSKYYEDNDGAFTATLEETDDAYIGHAYNEQGFVEKEKRRFNKNEWKPLFGGGAKMISIHIPYRAKFDAETLDKTISHTKQILKDHFPEYDYKLFFCGSWLLDTQLGKILHEDSNIVKFCRRFRPLAVKDLGNCIFGYVFNKPDMNFELSELPEDSSLQRAVKSHYLSGKVIYETFGYFLP